MTDRNRESDNGNNKTPPSTEDTLDAFHKSLWPTVPEGMPTESEYLGPAMGCIGVTQGVNDSSARLVPGFVPTRYELEVLARHYLDKARDTELWWRWYEQVGSSETRTVSFAYRRIATIENILGTERLTKAIADVKEKWNKKFAEADEEERALKPCSSCGQKRSLVDTMYDGDICGECNFREQESRLPPCKSCGGRQELPCSAHRNGLCGRCYSGTAV